MLDCVEYYKINNATTGLVLTDAAFLTEKSGKAPRVTFGEKDFGFPNVKSVLGVESLGAGIATRTPGYVQLAPLGGGMDPNWYRFRVPIPFYAIGTTEAALPPADEPYDHHKINMPWPDGSTLCDGTVSKLFGAGAATYSAFVLYRQFGSKAPPPKGGPVTVVTYDKGADSTTIVWNEFENGKQNAAGELQEDHQYRLLWGAFDAQALGDKEANLARVTVPGFPPLIFPGGGSCFGAAAGVGYRRVWFVDDSVVMRGDATHKVEGHIGAACQPLVHLGWEDMGKR